MQTTIRFAPICWESTVPCGPRACPVTSFRPPWTGLRTRWSICRTVPCSTKQQSAVFAACSKILMGPNLIADAYFGTFSGKGHWSYHPPERLTDLVDIDVVDVDLITDKDIREGENVLKTDYGEFPVSHECPYAILAPKAGSRVIATLGDHVVGAQTADGKLTWFGLSLSRAFGGAAPRELLMPLLASLACSAPFAIEGDRLIASQRGSKLRNYLIFLLNVEQKTAHSRIVAISSHKKRVRFSADGKKGVCVWALE